MTSQFRHFGEWLKHWREEFAMTQPEVGESVGVSKQQISNIERQQQHAASGAIAKPSIEVVDKLARLFNRPIDEARDIAGYGVPRSSPPPPASVEEALDPFLDQRGLSDEEKEKLKPLFEIVQREIERLTADDPSIPKLKGPIKIIDAEDVPKYFKEKYGDKPPIVQIGRDEDQNN